MGVRLRFIVNNCGWASPEDRESYPRGRQNNRVTLEVELSTEYSNVKMFTNSGR